MNKFQIQLIYDEFVKYEPKMEDNSYHQWNRAHNCLRAILLEHGGEDRIMKLNRILREKREAFKIKGASTVTVL